MDLSCLLFKVLDPDNSMVRLKEYIELVKTNATLMKEFAAHFEKWNKMETTSVGMEPFQCDTSFGSRSFVKPSSGESNLNISNPHTFSLISIFEQEKWDHPLLIIF